MPYQTTFVFFVILSVFLAFECAGQATECVRGRVCNVRDADPITFHLLPINKTRGQTCVVDDRAGTCVHWRHCYTMLVDHIDKKFPPVCSYEGTDPIVCCTSCKLVDDVSKANVISASGDVVWKTNQKSWNQCIDYSKDLPYLCKYGENWTVKKVWNETEKCFEVEKKLLGAKDTIGGRDAYRGEFPHMALLGYGPEEAAQWLCGGSIISSRFILTAAHCVSSASLGPVTLAALGILKRSEPEHLWNKYRIQDRIPHAEYKPPSKYHDIALLKTELPIKFSTFVMPACLPDMSRPAPASDTFAFAAGWGATGHRAALADTLQAVGIHDAAKWTTSKWINPNGCLPFLWPTADRSMEDIHGYEVDVEEYSSSSCSSDYKEHRHLLQGYDHVTQMCYGNMAEARDTCEGDSGGPLQTRGRVLECQHAVIGVTSFGHACGLAGRAGVYTRVRRYVPWLESVVWPDL